MVAVLLPRRRARVHGARPRAAARRHRRGQQPAPTGRADSAAPRVRAPHRRPRPRPPRGGVGMTILAEMPAPAAVRKEQPKLLELRGLAVEYGGVRAVDGVDLEIRAGEVVGLAGESGCGKSTVANAVMQILRPPARISGGSILFRGDDLVGKSTEELRRYRWRNVAMVFQSAMNALNPVMRVGDLAEGRRLFEAPEHPYTRGLMASFPPLTGPLTRLVGIPGAPPDLANPPSGCRFHTRCPLCVPGEPLYQRQLNERPQLRELE